MPTHHSPGKAGTCKHGKPESPGEGGWQCARLPHPSRLGLLTAISYWFFTGSGREKAAEEAEAAAARASSVPPLPTVRAAGKGSAWRSWELPRSTLLAVPRGSAPQQGLLADRALPGASPPAAATQAGLAKSRMVFSIHPKGNSHPGRQSHLLPGNWAHWPDPP